MITADELLGICLVVITLGCLIYAFICRVDAMLAQEGEKTARAENRKLEQIVDALDAENQAWARKHAERLRPLRDANARRAAKAKGVVAV